MNMCIGQSAGIAAICLAAGLAIVSAQDQIGTAQASEDAGAADTFTVLVPVRDIADIDREIAAAEAARMSAVESERATLDLRTGTKSRIQAKDVDIAGNKARRDLAKREQKTAELATIEAEGAALQREKEVLERRESLRDAELDLARKRGQLATLTVRALQLEKELAMKRIERIGFEGSRVAAVSLDRVVLDLERATLQAQKDRADRESDVADREKKVADRRLKLLDAQLKVFAG